MLTVEDFESAKRVLSSGEEFGPPLIADYIELLEKESGIDFSQLKKYLKSFLPFMQGEEHLRIRKQINKLFTRQALKEWSPNIVAAVDYRICQLDTNKPSDLILDVVDPLYMDLVEEVFGVKLPDRETFIRNVEVATNAVERMASVSQLKKLQKILIDLDELVSQQLSIFEKNTLFRQIVDKVNSEINQEDVVSILLALLIAARATTETIAHIIVEFIDSR